MRKRSCKPVEIGKTYNRLKIVKEIGIRKNPSGVSHNYVKAKCICGNIIEVSMSSIRSGNTKSCGCLRWDNLRRKIKKHGLCQHLIYGLWQGMRKRCRCGPTDKNYKLYAGKGIRVCVKWDRNFLLFYNWAISHGWKKGLILDRKNGNKGYYPSNCRFITPLASGRNTSKNKMITWKGITKCLSEWSIIIGIPSKTIGNRIKNGIQVEEALTKKRIKRRFQKKPK
jgi:hypothetical protein